jgi:hypothetical protein
MFVVGVVCWQVDVCVTGWSLVQRLWPTEGGFGVLTPPEIPKALKNCAKLNPICENCKKLLNLGRQHPKMFGKKAVKF